MQHKEPFIINRLKSVAYAFKGMCILFRTEASIKIQLVIATLVTIAGFYFEISRYEWMMQTAMIGLVMSLEGINTAIEHLADFVHIEKHQKIGLIKDIAAGAVFIAACVAATVGFIIYLPKLL